MKTHIQSIIPKQNTNSKQNPKSKTKQDNKKMIYVMNINLKSYEPYVKERFA